VVFVLDVRAITACGFEIASASMCMLRIRVWQVWTIAYCQHIIQPQKRLLRAELN
jgi:hypothetical protein